MTKYIQSIIDNCLLNTCTDMGNARSDMALALLLLSSQSPKLVKKARRIFRQEQKKLSSSSNWDDKLKILFHIGFLKNEGIQTKDIAENVSSYMQNVHYTIKYSLIQDDTKSPYLAHLLFHFIIPPLYGIRIDNEEETVLLRIGKHLHQKVTENDTFITIPFTNLYQLYLTAAILNNCTEAINAAIQDVISLYKSCKLQMSYPMSALISYNLKTKGKSFVQDRSMSFFKFYNILGIRDMTNYILGELICNDINLTRKFMSDEFLTEEHLTNLISNDKNRFSLHTGLARILLTYILASHTIDKKNTKNLAMILMVL